MEEVNEHYFRGFQRIFFGQFFHFGPPNFGWNYVLYSTYKSFSNNIFTVTVNKPYKVLGYPAKAGGTAL